MKKSKLLYLSPDCFTQVDDTVLHHLTKDFQVIWFYIYESGKAKSMRYNPEKAREYAIKNGITLEVVDYKMRRCNPKSILFYQDIARRINSYCPDIVYSCSFFPFWTYCYTKIECNKKIIGIHDVSSHSYKFSVRHVVSNIFKLFWIKRFRHIFTFSLNQQQLLKEKYGKDSIMVGMSCKYFGVSKQTLLPIQQGVRLLFFGRISKYKGLDLLIQAMERLKSQGVNNLQLTIAGKGESWEECKALIKTPKIYNLQIRFIDNEEIPDLMSSHHFLVLPYRDATQSGPLVAALGYGLPVVAPSYGCFSDTLNEKVSILYKQGDLADALKKISAMREVDYQQLKQAMIALRENYSEERIAENYINSFMKILNTD